MKNSEKPVKRGFFTSLTGLAFLFIVLPVISLSAVELRFKHLTIVEGLSQNSINAVIKDDRGFIWLGTQDGFNRYDGYSFSVFKQVPGNRNSLSHSYILCLLKDRDGMIWIGTEAGLNRFNPQTERFTRFLHDQKKPDSLTDNRILCLHESLSEPGIIWVGTERGLNRLDTRSLTFSFFSEEAGENECRLKNTMIRAIGESRTEPGVVWVGTQEGLFRLEIAEKKISSFVSDPGNQDSISHNHVLAIMETAAEPGILWIGTESGLNRYNLETKKFTRYLTEAGNPASISHNNIRALYQSPLQPDCLWIGTYGGGINRLEIETGAFQRFQPDSEDPFSINDSFVLCFLEDPDGILWIGTEGGGLNYLERNPRGFGLLQHKPELPNSLVGNLVRSILEPRENPDLLWIATYGGLNIWDRRAGRHVHYRHNPADPVSLGSNYIRHLFQDSGGDIWIATQNMGLDRYDRDIDGFVHYRHDPQNPGSISHNYVRVISEDWEGNLWLGTVGGGLNRMSANRSTISRYPVDQGDGMGLSSNRIYAIQPDPRAGIIWVGTSMGLNRLDPESGQFTWFKHDPEDPDSLSNNMVMSLHLDRKGRLWVGTWGGGLNLLRENGARFDHITEADGLANNVVYSILEDDQGFLWISTNLGLSRFNPVSRDFHNFDVHDGLQSNEFNANSCFRSQAGEMFFGGINGLTYFFPEQIHFNTVVPTLHITGFLLFNRPVPVGEQVRGRVILTENPESMEKINLSYRENIIGFEFTALNYIQPEKNRYAYMLEGLEKEWNYVGGRRFAAYSPPPGNYVFRVKAANNDGVWNQEGVSIRLHITPPFWQTWWFYGLAVLFIGSSALGLVRMRIRNLTKAKQELEKLVAERTRQLREASLTDPLTGLRNRRFISEVLQSDITAFIGLKNYLLQARDQRTTSFQEAVFGLFMLDIDFFKKVNDERGHDAGDLVLKQLAELLKESVRLDDVVMRLGGEEFLIVLKKTNPEYLSVFADKILKKVADARFDIGGGKFINKTCSIGFVSFPVFKEKPDLLSFERSIMIADLGLLYAKSHGRSQGVSLVEGAKLPHDDDVLQKVTTDLKFALQEDFLRIGHIVKVDEPE